MCISLSSRPLGGRLVVRVFLSLVVFILLFDVVLVVGEDSGSAGGAGTLAVLFISLLCIVCHVVAMAHFPQSRWTAAASACLYVLYVLCNTVVGRH